MENQVTFLFSWDQRKAIIPASWCLHRRARPTGEIKTECRSDREHDTFCCSQAGRECIHNSYKLSFCTRHNPSDKQYPHKLWFESYSKSHHSVWSCLGRSSCLL